MIQSAVSSKWQAGKQPYTTSIMTNIIENKE
jgi:hypothetical protein